MNGESGDVVERSKSLETQNENLKQTVYRLSLELRSQKQVYEDEIEYLRTNVNNQDKEIAELEKAKDELKAKVGALSSQIVVCNDEIVSKSKEIEKLRTIIKGNEMSVSKDSQPISIPSIRTQPHNQSQFPRKNPISLRTSKGIVGVGNEGQQQQQQKNENDFDLITTNLKNLTLTLSAQINKQNEHLEKNSIIMDSLKNAVNAFKSNNSMNNNKNQKSNNYYSNNSSRFRSVPAEPGAELIVGDATTTQHLSGDNHHPCLNKYLIQSHGSGWKLNSHHHIVQRRETPLQQQLADMGIRNGKDQDPWGIQEISDLGLLGSHYSHSFLTPATPADKDTLTDTELEMEISKLKEHVDAITSENLDLKEKLGQLNEQTTAICEEINILRTNQNDLLQMWFS